MRYHILDNIRGLVFISMIVFHTMWDLVNIYGVDAPWFASDAAYWWQQSILYCFVLLSGFCWGLGHHPLKRGLIVFACGALVTAVTFVALPDDPAIFGVLTCLGLCMMVMIPLERGLRHIPATAGLAVFAVLFLLLRGVPFGYLGFQGFPLVELPRTLYANLATAFLGFQPTGFVSSDYVPSIPWLALYICGYFLRRCLRTSAADDARLRLPDWREWPIVGWIGRHSLIIYLLHQPIIYAVCWVIFAALAK